MTSPDDMSMLAALLDAIGMNPERLGSVLEECSRPSESELIQSFLDDDWYGLQTELEGLATQPMPTPRILVFERVIEDAHPFDLDFDDDDDVDEDFDVSWHYRSVDYAPSDYIRGDRAALRKQLNAALARRGPDTESVAIWLFKSRSPLGQSAITLFFKDSNGFEELYLFTGGPLLRHPRGTEAIGEELEQIQSVYGVPDEQRLVRALITQGAIAELDARLSELTDRSSAASAKAVTEWLESCPIVRDALESLVRERVGFVQDEAQHWLRTSTRDVVAFMEELRAENAQSLRDLEKQKEKRMKGLRSDVEKMRMLSDGVRSRADKADADNRALRRRVTDLEARLASSVTAATTAEPEGAVKALRRALDTYF
jgi:polyhydroxyalkanoate synthesis regulator phasin